jgi:phenylalanyl-tRNA synthetase beta chain
VGAIVDGGFFRAKGAVEALHAAVKSDVSFERTTRPLLHPGKAARFASGWVGELHPTVLEGTWAALELDLEELLAGSRDPVAYADVVTYPALRQDVAFAVGDDVTAGELVAAVREAGGPELREARVFDVYRGEQVGPGRKSVAIALTFQSPERTLTDEDAAQVRERIVAAVADRFGGELRA